ncbi:MAG: SlyX family protein [Bacteroides sp.]|nr:SlyX family protein [Bacteroides sp.]
MKTNLNHFRWIIALIAMLPATGFAQTEADKVNERLEKIESKLLQQESTINSLRQEIEAVTKQNLALKQNLNLKPTIAKSVEDGVMDFRVIEVNGNPETGDVDIILTANNLGIEDKSWGISKLQTIDELGTGYDSPEQFAISVGDDEAKNIYSSGEYNYHPNAPYKIKIKIKKFNPEAQYIKYLNMRMRHSLSNIEGVFENLPIKWVSNE